MATLNNSSTQHPADGQHTPGGRCTGAIFFQNIKTEKKSESANVFKYTENYLTKCSFFRGASMTFTAQMSCVQWTFELVRKRNHYFSYHCLQTFRLFIPSKEIVSEGLTVNLWPTVHTYKLSKNVRSVRKYVSLVCFCLGVQYRQVILVCWLSKGINSSIQVNSQHFQGKNISRQNVRNTVANGSNVIIKIDKNPKGNMWMIKGWRGRVGVVLEDVLMAWSVGPVSSHKTLDQPN